MKISVAGCLYTDQLDKFGIGEIEVNPFFAFWNIRFIGLDGNAYQTQTDLNGCFSINLSPDKSFVMIVLDHQEKFRAQLCFPHTQFKNKTAYFVFKTPKTGSIDFNRITISSYSAFTDTDYEPNIIIDRRYAARDMDNDHIHDGFDINSKKIFKGFFNLNNDLDNDGVPDDKDFDIDGDGLINLYDSDIDDDGIANDLDEDNTNDGVNDYIPPLPPRITLNKKIFIVNGMAKIFVTLFDDNADNVNLDIDYSADNEKIFMPASVSQTDTTNLTARPEGVKHVLVWDSYADFGFINQDNLIIRITAYDKDNTGTPLVIKNLTVRNNHSPKIMINYPEGNNTVSGKINISLETQDQDIGQTVKINGLWFSPDKKNFVLIKDNLTADTFLWDTARLGSINKCWLRAEATDGIDTTSVLTEQPFSIRNNSENPNILFAVSGISEKIFSDMVSLRWNFSSTYSPSYSLYYSNDGINWTEITKNLKNNFYIWDISAINPADNTRIMVKAETKENIRYAFSPEFIVKHKNHPPVITFVNPQPNKVLSDFVMIEWKADDTDPGDTIKKVSLFYKISNQDEFQKIVSFTYNPGEYLWDISALNDCKNVAIKIIASDGEMSGEIFMGGLKVNNPPRVLSADTVADSVIRIKFNEPVKNVYKNIKISEGVKIFIIKRVNGTTYDITTSALEQGKEYAVSFFEGITDLSGLNIIPFSFLITTKIDSVNPALLYPPVTIDLTHIDIVFDEKMNNAQFKKNYRIEPFLKINAVLDLGNNAYRIVTDNQENIVYTVFFKNITDISGNPINADSKINRFKGFSAEKIVKIDHNGNGDFKDINEAVLSAPQGAILYAAKGNYKNVKIPAKKHLTIWGGFNPQTWRQDDSAKTIIHGDNKNSALFSDGIIRLINISLTNGLDGLKIYTGNCVIYGCDIYQNKGNGVFVSGNAKISVINSKIYENNSCGVIFLGSLTFTLLNNVIANNKDNGIELNSKGSALLVNNIITFNKYGIFIKKTGAGMPAIKNNCFYKNNHGNSLDGSFAILDSSSKNLRVINNLSQLNTADLLWNGNMVVDPLLKKDSFIPAKLIKNGNNQYNYILKHLPESITKKSGPVPVGIF
ncbi:right-handed parallel beta-helix repeat-containing protein [bacterium]|nr:right-handed parallel beta-helix repeat-containing protein [bacterium]